MVVSTYAATDQESTENDDRCAAESAGSTCSWSLSGPDAADFSIDTGGVLSFKNAPNYESPADANTDNVYMVTVVATDSTSPRLTATWDVVITIVSYGFKVIKNYGLELTHRKAMASSTELLWRCLGRIAER